MMYNPMLKMLCDLLAVLIALGSIFFLPIKLAFLIAIILYTALLVTEIKVKVLTPVTSLVLLIYMSLFIYCFIFDKQDWLPYTGSIFYFSLAFMAFISLFAKRPFTLYGAIGKGIMSLHYLISWIWAFTYLLSGIMSIFLIPDLAFIYVPFLFVCISILLTIFFIFFYISPTNKREKFFHIEKYSFKQLVNYPQDVEEFYALTAKERWAEMSISHKKLYSSITDLQYGILEEYTGEKRQVIRFLAYTPQKTVGTICAILDSDKGLIMERETGVDLDELRKFGKIIEVGCFTISRSHRFRRSVFLGLFKAVIDFALENDIDFIASSSYDTSAKIYEKSDFIKLGEQYSIDPLIGIKLYPYLFNLSKEVVYVDKSINNTVLELKDILNPYLAERYYKRQLISKIFQKSKNRSYNLQKEDIIRLCQTN
jgi:hypothetical protein